LDEGFGGVKGVAQAECVLFCKAGVVMGVPATAAAAAAGAAALNELGQAGEERVLLVGGYDL